ncbi:MAG: hypothetical protein A3H02_01170 [Candidatus Niyogibacteria bacterium RIFCSPLOWO2_12_FULL_41_13]|uniref:Metallo-beta-lactamase domain-containing protein n=1 Tax=Candidatus Niyogibacteria bacterium RIFCSPLOWO2_12_FULL_41_13 TaxID=1801726 RepID=A0A1G2F3Q7_9BACT|nr:MAG: hypothetical protein A3H02_01170 [Candidatus Niyogibacteria bacterium RIFCSPLOWO2_12_FULL_41_13]
MLITYHGVSCFKIQSKDLTLVFDPPSKESEFKPPRFNADIAFISHEHANHNGKENFSKESFVIEGPGEYEFKGVFAKGMETFHDSSKGKKNGLNTVYLVELEDIKLCHFGDFGEGEISPDLREKIGLIDILFLPIDPEFSPAEKALKIISELEPKLVIPAHWHLTKKHRAHFEEFLKEFNKGKIQEEEKIAIKSKELKEKQGFELRVLKPQI